MQHLRQTVEILGTNPRLALYIRRLVVHAYRMFSPGPMRMTEAELKKALATLNEFNELFTPLLELMVNIETLVFVGLQGRHACLDMMSPASLQRLYTFMTRPEGNIIKRIELYGYAKLERSSFNTYPPSLESLRCWHCRFVDADQEFSAENLQFRLKELEIEGTHSNLLDSMISWRSGWHLSRLTTFAQWVVTVKHSDRLSSVLQLASSTLVNLTIAVYGRKSFCKCAFNG